MTCLLMFVSLDAGLFWKWSVVKVVKNKNKAFLDNLVRVNRIETT